MRFTSIGDIMRSAKRSETAKMKKERLGIETDEAVERQYREEKKVLKEAKSRNTFLGKAKAKLKERGARMSQTRGGRPSRGLFSTPRNILEDNKRESPWIGTQDSGGNIWTGQTNKPRRRRRKARR